MFYCSNDSKDDDDTYQSANQRAREMHHARAVKPTWNALCSSSKASNVHKPQTNTYISRQLSVTQTLYDT